MSKKEKQKTTETSYIALVTKGIRKDWNGVNPITRVVESKRYKPTKHKKRDMERETDGT